MLQRIILSNIIVRTITSSSKKAEDISQLLANRLFTDKHEWVMVQDKIGTVGISDYAQNALGDIVYAQLPDEDTLLKQKDECGALESVKAASEIYSPISGKVIVKNTQVEDNPSLINKSCYDKGWLFKVEMDDTNELKALMTAEKYLEFLKTDPEVSTDK
ncbi:uncharacterized protein LOC108734659 [Agrilus planipennis]|uniref:Glycine cleavage system H protein n=1 Tax=Agrilus planipennis TaxID=224129 RepID=A0A1W4WMW5_AGRPL|nr:uncharacterized protein LOC108734659 [Agrilus planipennis]